jgi:hypothetical protein
MASHFGVPLSTTHTIGTAIMGVGATRRLSAVNWTVSRQIVMTWLLTFPACLVMGFVFTWLFLEMDGGIGSFAMFHSPLRIFWPRPSQRQFSQPPRVRVVLERRDHTVAGREKRIGAADRGALVEDALPLRAQADHETLG